MPRLESVEAVTFDVGGTLIEPSPSVGHVYAELAAEFGLRNLDPGRLNRQFAAAWKARRQFDYSRAAWSEIVTQTFAGLSPVPPNAACFDAIYEGFGRAARWRIYPDVLPALERMQAMGLKLGVISNWDERLRPLLAELKLTRWFRAVVISHEVGEAKPEPQIFRRATEWLKVNGDRTLHVGDSWSEDVVGARDAGWRAVLLDRSAVEAGPGAVRSLADLE
jgi:putative hydrolase of the HAD superfamily